MTHLVMLARQWDYWWSLFRRTWRASVISSFLSPLLYVGAMGVLLGRYVDDAARLGMSYVDYIVPGLLASTSMQIAMGETMWPVMGALKWDRTYYAMAATPLRVADIALGHLWSVVSRTTVAGAVFLLTMTVLGAVDGSPVRVVGALLAQVLVAFAFGAPCYALATRVERDSMFSVVYRVVITPLFLFSGAFFPVSNLSPVLQVVASASPLYHAVELTRGLAQGNGHALGMLGNAGYLLVLAGIGIRLSVTGLGRRLRS